MDNEPLEPIEQQVLGLRPRGAPRQLREPVLGEVERELRAARWDRRLVRLTVVLLVVGVGLNGVAGLRDGWSQQSQSSLLAERPASGSIVETAVVVAESTDAETGRQFARHLAALRGRVLTGGELAAFDAAVATRHSHVGTNGGDG